MTSDFEGLRIPRSAPSSPFRDEEIDKKASSKGPRIPFFWGTLGHPASEKGYTLKPRCYKCPFFIFFSGAVVLHICFSYQKSLVPSKISSLHRTLELMNHSMDYELPETEKTCCILQDINITSSKVIPPPFARFCVSRDEKSTLKFSSQIFRPGLAKKNTTSCFFEEVTPTSPSGFTKKNSNCYSILQTATHPNPNHLNPSPPKKKTHKQPAPLNPIENRLMC